MKLTEIIFLNDVIQRHRSQGAKVQLIMVPSILILYLVDTSNYTIFCRRVGTSFSCSVPSILTVRCLEYHQQWR